MVVYLPENDRTFTPGKIPTVYSAEEAAKRRFHKVDCGRGIWLYPDCDNPAENLYFRGHGVKRSEGFGGATLTFTLVDGSTIELQGPWHGNSHSMFLDTGIDLSKTHRTFGVIAREMERTGWEPTYKNLLHLDEGWVLGQFDRITALAEDIAEELDIKVYFYRQSSGGSAQCRIDGREEAIRQRLHWAENGYYREKIHGKRSEDGNQQSVEPQADGVC